MARPLVTSVTDLIHSAPATAVVSSAPHTHPTLTPGRLHDSLTHPAPELPPPGRAFPTHPPHPFSLTPGLSVFFYDDLPLHPCPCFTLCHCICLLASVLSSPLASKLHGAEGVRLLLEWAGQERQARAGVWKTPFERQINLS